MKSIEKGVARYWGEMPHGVKVLPLDTISDDRGALTELFRESWDTVRRPVQWNHVQSDRLVMRGMHIHLGYDEYYLLLKGRTTIGYRDTRPASPTEGCVAMIEITGDKLCALMAPPGIAHGILVHEPSTLLIGMSAFWNMDNELGCHWLDPELGIPWPTTEAALSERDASLPPLSEVISLVPPWVGE